MLAGGDQLQRRRLVHAVGRRVDRGVELAPGDGLVEPAEGVGISCAVGEVAGPLGVEIDAATMLAAGDRGEFARRGGAAIAPVPRMRAGARSPEPLLAGACSFGPFSVIFSRRLVDRHVRGLVRRRARRRRGCRPSGRRCAAPSARWRRGRSDRSRGRGGNRRCGRRRAGRSGRSGRPRRPRTRR